MYCFNNTVVVDHDGLFIYVDAGYPGSFHDISILKASCLYKNWRNYFTHELEYFEYVLGDRNTRIANIQSMNLNSVQ